MSETPYWLQFFVDAGIPAAIAKKYAVTFVANRMQKNLLMELKKDFLQDMGFSAMGDIMAILKHSKIVAKEMNLQSDAKKSQEMSKEKPVSPIKRKLAARSKPAQPVYSAQSQVNRASLTADSLSAFHAARYQLPVTRRASTNIDTEYDEDAEEQVFVSVAPIQHPKIVSSPEESDKKLVSLKRTLKSQDQVPVQVKRRVPPEQEGSYTIKMPDGTVRKAGGKYSVRAALNDEPKTSIFSRLSSPQLSTSPVETEDLSSRLSPVALVKPLSQRLGRIVPNAQVEIEETRRIRKPTGELRPSTVHREPVVAPPRPGSGIIRLGSSASRDTTRVRLSARQDDSNSSVFSRLSPTPTQPAVKRLTQPVQRPVKRLTQPVQRPQVASAQLPQGTQRLQLTTTRGSQPSTAASSVFNRLGKRS